MAKVDKRPMVTLSELVVSSLATADALAKNVDRKPALLRDKNPSLGG